MWHSGQNSRSHFLESLVITAFSLTIREKHWEDVLWVVLSLLKICWNFVHYTVYPPIVEVFKMEIVNEVIQHLHKVKAGFRIVLGL